VPSRSDPLPLLVIERGVGQSSARPVTKLVELSSARRAELGFRGGAGPKGQRPLKIWVCFIYSKIEDKSGGAGSQADQMCQVLTTDPRSNVATNRAHTDHLPSEQAITCTNSWTSQVTLASRLAHVFSNPQGQAQKKGNACSILAILPTGAGPNRWKSAVKVVFACMFT
jgi:hypothetical protein